MKETLITEDEFEARFRPQPNPLNPNASWSGWLLETYGEEFKLVQDMLNQDPARVWTILDGDEGCTIGSGFHVVNALGYIITEVPCPADEFVDTVAESVDPDEDNEKDKDPAPATRRPKP